MDLVKKYDPPTDINLYATHIHELNAKWWYDEAGNSLNLYPPERFMLMISEVAEGMEGVRKNRYDDHLPAYPMLWVEMADTVIRILDCAHAYNWMLNAGPVPHITEHKEKVTGKLYNICEMICMLGYFHMDNGEGYSHGAIALSIINRCKTLAEEDGCQNFWQLVYEKLVFNWHRQDHSYAARNAEGGKKF